VVVIKGCGCGEVRGRRGAFQKKAQRKKKNRWRCRKKSESCLECSGTPMTQEEGVLFLPRKSRTRSPGGRGLSRRRKIGAVEEDAFGIRKGSRERLSIRRFLTPWKEGPSGNRGREKKEADIISSILEMGEGGCSNAVFLSPPRRFVKQGVRPRKGRGGMKGCPESFVRYPCRKSFCHECGAHCLDYKEDLLHTLRTGGKVIGVRRCPQRERAWLRLKAVGH